MTPSHRDRIFILEDDRDLLTQLEAIARGCGYNVTCARTVRQALEAIKDLKDKWQSPQLALVDMMVPSDRADCEELDALLAKKKEMTLRQPDSDVGEAADTLQSDRESLIEIKRRIFGLLALDGGLTFLEQAAEEKLLGNCPVVIFTVRAFSDLARVRAVEEHLRGKVSWHQKPLDPQILINLLNREHS